MCISNVYKVALILSDHYYSSQSWEIHKYCHSNLKASSPTPHPFTVFSYWELCPQTPIRSPWSNSIHYRQTLPCITWLWETETKTSTLYFKESFFFFLQVCTVIYCIGKVQSKLSFMCICIFWGFMGLCQSTKANVLHVTVPLSCQIEEWAKKFR